MDHPGAPGEAHGKEETMDEVFIDDSQGHGDDQLVVVQLGLGLKLNTKIQIHPPTQELF